MRLFNQERSTGWASRKIGGNNEHWIILGIGLGIALPAAILRRKSAVVRKHLDLGTIYVVVFVLVPALVLLAFQSGKASLFPPFPGVVEEPFGCCSQAMIFPRAQIPALVSFLQRRKEGQVDLLLNDWADEAGLERCALYPVQAQHIG